MIAWPSPLGLELTLVSSERAQMTAAMYDLPRAVQLRKHADRTFGPVKHVASGRPIPSRPSRLTRRAVSFWAPARSSSL